MLNRKRREKNHGVFFDYSDEDFEVLILTNMRLYDIIALIKNDHRRTVHRSVGDRRSVASAGRLSDKMSSELGYYFR